jgi:UDP-N-acetylmuramate: L-alanyl-gamma-D-glutamyl-meso-diaminopimelate ligase
LGARGHSAADVATLARELARSLRPGDHVLVMSNGGFGGLHGKLLAELERSAAAPPGTAFAARGS